MPQTLENQSLKKLNAVRVLIVLMIAIGYASTMPTGPGNQELMTFVGYDPSWYGISLLFFMSGFLAKRSLERHGSAQKYLASRIIRNGPMLVVVTLIAVLVLYPLFGVSQGSFAETAKVVGLYFLGTITCLKAGEPLPGLLDDAKYMCLIQGAIWTLKWGLLAHIATAISQKIGLLKNRYVLLSLALASILTNIALKYTQINLGIPIYENLLLGAHLAWPFLTGMAAYAFSDRLPKSSGKMFAGSALLLALSWIWFTALPWTPVIETLAMLGFSAGALSMLRLKPEQLPILNNWMPLTLAIYLVNWPVSQMLLLGFPATSPIGLIFMSLPVTIIVAAVLHYFVSRRSFDFAARRFQTASGLAV